MSATAAAPVTVGIVGYGYATKTFHAPLVQAAPGLRLAAVATSGPAKLHADWPDVEAVADPAALFAREDLELVVIATANDSHYALAKQALEAGKHVVVDKPFTVTLEEARALDALAQQRGRVLSVFHNRRWDGDFLTLRRELAAGTLGRIVHFESHFDRYRPEVRDRWRERDGPGAGLWYDLGAHLVDQALQLFGAPEAIWLDTARQRDGAAVDDWFHAVLRYGALRVVLHASVVAAHLGPRYLVHGLAGSLVKHGLDPQEDALRAGVRPATGLATGTATGTATAGWGVDARSFEHVTCTDGDRRETRTVIGEAGAYPAYYAALAAAIRGEGANPVPAAEAIAVMTLLELGLHSAAERRELAVPAALAERSGDRATFSISIQ